MRDANTNLWTLPDHVLEYLAMADSIPHRREGEAVLLECLPQHASRVLDLGSGDGRLLFLVKLARPDVTAVAADFSPAMLSRLRERFGADTSIQVVAHDMDEHLPRSLEHVASPTLALHERFLGTLGMALEDEDPSNKLLDVETQLTWLREIGFLDVDCLWKWRELALLAASTR